MVDLSGGPDGPIEHGFSNTVFIIPAIVVIGLADRKAVLDQLDGRGRIDEGVEIPENFVHEVPGSGSEPPGSLASILESLDNIQGLSDQEKLELRDELLKAMAGGEAQDAPTGDVSVFAQTIVFLVALGIIVSILAFFGMKLYRSLSERERKREEKRKLKQQKKKK